MNPKLNFGQRAKRKIKITGNKTIHMKTKSIKTINLKTIKPLLVAALALGAINANADWTVVGPADINVTPGESGTSTYVFIPTSSTPPSGLIVSETSSYQPEGTSSDQAFGPNAPILDYLPTVSPVGDTVYAETPIDIVVNWTISSNPAFVGDKFSANYAIDTDAYGSAGAAQNLDFTVVPAPEPGQTLAGAVLLGCGSIVFLHRRMLQNKNATA